MKLHLSHVLILIPVVVASSLVGCSAEIGGGSRGSAGGGTGATMAGDASSGGSVGWGTGGGQAAKTGGAGGLFGVGGSDADPLPPETEAPPSFRAPVVTGRYLWSANPSSGRVALIDAETLTTRVFTAGLQPTHLVAVPSDPNGSSEHDEPAALVLNTGSSDATLLRLLGDTVKVSHVSTHFGANRWALSHAGRWAVAWTEAIQSSEELDPTEGLQEVTLLDLSSEPPSRRRISVGYQPSLVTFDDKDQTMIVVSTFGISLVDVETEELTWIELGEDTGREVSITENGGHALVRRSGATSIEVVRLDGSGQITAIELGGEITDLDLAPTGRAVAVVREASLMATFLVRDVVESAQQFDTLSVPGEVVGSVELTDTGTTAVLFSNAGESSRVTVVDLSDDFLAHRTLTAESPVESVVISPDGAHAVTLAKGTEGAQTGSFSVLALTEERFPRVVGTNAPLADVRLGNRVGVVTATSASGVHEAHLISLPSLDVDPVALASPPTSAGLLPELELGFAAQRHTEGRVTFFDFTQGDARTLTGFELSAEAVQE